MDLKWTAADMEATKKVYVHFEGQPEYTHVAKITWGLTAEELASEFTRAYNAKHGRIVSLDPATIRLLNGKNRMSKSANLIRLVKDRSDIFVERELPSSTHSLHTIEHNSTSNDGSDAKPPEASLAITPATGELSPYLQEQSQLEAELVSAVRGDEPFGQDMEEPVIRRVLEYALKVQQLKQYKLASSMFSKILAVLPKQPICLRALGSMSLAVQNYAEAIPWLRRGVNEYPLDAIFHARLGDSYAGLGLYKDALMEYDLALGLTEEQKPGEIARKDVPDHAVDLDSQGILSDQKRHRSQLLDDPSAGDILGTVTRDGLKISSAAVFGKCGEGDLANVILKTILNQSAENLDALLQFGVLKLSLGLVEEALKIFLKLLVSKPGDERVRSSLSKAIRHPQAMGLLRKEILVGPSAAPAVAFLASCVKDHGAIDEAVELYTVAIKLSPSSVGYILSLIHLYEVMYEYLKALGLAVSLFESLPSFSLHKFQFSDVIPYFDGPNWTDSPDSISQQCQYRDLKFQAQSEFFRWFDRLPPSKQLESTSDLGTHSPEVRMPDVKFTYNDQQLDGLAVLFTVTKILFVGGALERAKHLARLIEPAREASFKPLHQTIIRNEAAYFTSMHQILEEHPVPLPLPLPKEQRPLYLAGDSHCMSAAWRTVRLRGQNRLLVPMLVTGLKVWHLRPESNFYPKYAFENAMQSVADGAQLVMVYGEIDCREGILLSVEKGIYRDVEEGVEIIVSVYLEVLQQLIFSRGFELFVHPVPPVLNETRSVVHIFNRILKRRLEGIKEKSPIGKRLHWLDFLLDLLTAGGFLKEEFKLDGTHLSPKYSSLLQREFRKVRDVSDY